MGNDNFFKINGKTITVELPVEFGSKVYSYSIECGNFCMSEKFENVFPDRESNEARCMPCCYTNNSRAHVTEFVLNWDWLRIIIPEWNVKFFATKEEAEKVMNEIIERNCKKMRELGFKIDENGDCVIKE